MAYSRKGRGIGGVRRGQFFFVYPRGRRLERRPEKNRPRLTRPRGSRGNLQLMVSMSGETKQEGAVDGLWEGEELLGSLPSALECASGRRLSTLITEPVEL